MDSCKIALQESKWILALGPEFLTLDIMSIDEDLQNQSKVYMCSTAADLYH